MPLSETQVPITVVLVEDDRRSLAHLLAAIEAEPRLRLAAAFERANPARAWIETNVFDVLLTDIGLPDGSGIDVIRACVVAKPHADIMVVSMFGDEQNVLSSIEAGATGYTLAEHRRLPAPPRSHGSIYRGKNSHFGFHHRACPTNGSDRGFASLRAIYPYSLGTPRTPLFAPELEDHSNEPEH